jgi:large subunit ribosomal protein L5
MNRLKTKYEKEILPQLAREFGIKNRMAVPKVTKIVVNQGTGDISKNKELLAQAKENMAKITGQAPSVRQASVSVASFSIRRGMPVGLKVTLRGARSYDFLDRLISIVLPRLRDFRGLSRKSFDKSGNYTLGIDELTVFPEIDIAKAGPSGLEVTIVTSTGDTKKAEKLLELLGMPFEKVQSKN